MLGRAGQGEQYVLQMYLYPLSPVLFPIDLMSGPSIWILREDEVQSREVSLMVRDLLQALQCLQSAQQNHSIDL